MKNILGNEDGLAMVIALLFVTVLGVLAAIITGVATTEKNTSFNDQTYTRTFYSADAGGEAAVNWLRFQNGPPDLLDEGKNVHIPTGYDSLAYDSKYKYGVVYERKRLRPGWSTNYKDFEYSITSDGATIRKSEAQIEVDAMRLFKEGY